MHKEWTLLLGRWQVPEPHEGHRFLINKLLNEDKNVIIGLKKENGDDNNPYTSEQRKIQFEKLYYKEIEEGRLMILCLPDIVEIAHGRKVGWSVREIKVPDEIAKISGTDIRRSTK